MKILPFKRKEEKKTMLQIVQEQRYNRLLRLYESEKELLAIIDALADDYTFKADLKARHQEKLEKYEREIASRRVF